MPSSQILQCKKKAKNAAPVAPAGYMAVHIGEPQWCKHLVQKPPFFAPDMVQIVVQKLWFLHKMVQKHGAVCASFCTTFCTILDCKQSFRTILGGSRVRGQRPLSFDSPKPPHFNPLVLRGLCPLRIVWGAFWDRGCFLDRLMGRVGRRNTETRLALLEQCEVPDLPEAPKPRKIKSSSKVTKK